MALETIEFDQIKHLPSVDFDDTSKRQNEDFMKKTGFGVPGIEPSAQPVEIAEMSIYPNNAELYHGCFNDVAQIYYVAGRMQMNDKHFIIASTKSFIPKRILHVEKYPISSIIHYRTIAASLL